MTRSVAYTTLDGSTRSAMITDLPVLDEKKKVLVVPFINRDPMPLRADGSIVAVFSGDKGWAQFGSGRRRVWKSLTRRVVRGRVKWEA